MSSKPLLLPLFSASVNTDRSWERLDGVADVFDCPHSTPQLVDDVTAPYVVRSQDVRSGTFQFQNAAHVSFETYKERIKRVEPQYGDLLYSREGTYFGIAAEVPKGMQVCLGQRMVLIRPDASRIDHLYLKYWLNSPQVFGHIHGFRDGTVAERLNLPVIRGLAIAFPSLAAQRATATILSALDDRITLLRETNATLEAIARALYKSWFVDFDPVHAKREGRIPAGMDEATLALFPDGFEESEFGPVPKGWQLAPFGRLLSHTIGGDWGSEEPNEKDDTRVAIIRGTDIPDLQSGANNRVPIRYTSGKKLASRKLQRGDLILEVSGGSKDQPTGRSLYMSEGLLQHFDCPVEPASFCRLLRPHSEHIGVLLGQHLSYIYAQGKTWEYQNQSTGIANFQTAHFLEAELVAVPSDEVLSAFAGIVCPMIDRSHLTQMHRLAEVRDTLLPRLIAGQLRLPEAEALVA
ncbi:hypothetical protein PTKU46_58610 [Paraburkholderia terrae]|uniref:restriction endonuclease subunit S n=1 Tax=Paraburkholderia terrae TaxID=311230 RepID=UPI0030E4558D